eukprot:TRINITY_DN5037_c0_g1_i4.p1 TRINITY_DN5037_c0_g1~~TRINITY_DN5037_c0_g1_i4.p1  ORF type:complete len:261 (-),score=63.30 TRINITY_DN5037_c0_g1_i4:212-994(-)
MILNVFNGECACDAWKKSGGASPALTWRENYLEGHIPGLETPLADFERIRAEELHRLMPELDFEKLLDVLRNMDKTILELSENDSVFLWFDACMYDQIMLSRILFLLKDSPAAVFLICEDIAWGDSPELFADKMNCASPLDKSTIHIYASAWEAVARGAETLKRLLAAKSAEHLPFLAKALTRYQEEFPGVDGLGRSERQLLEIIRSGKHTSSDIFLAFGTYEEHPFMGDTMCWRMLESMAEKGFLTIQSDEKEKIYHLS